MRHSRQQADFLVIGSGIVGLSVAWHLRSRGSVIVVDKEPTVAFHQTGRNSGVIHSGVYYQPGSLKAQLCTDGRIQLEAFASDHGVEVRRSGKLIVATTESQQSGLDELGERGERNGLTGLRRLTAEETKVLEPAVRAVGSLLVPETGLIDYRTVAAALVRDIQEAGGQIISGFEVEAIADTARPVVVAADGRSVTVDAAVNCGGLHSDRLARLAGADPDVQIVPFRGGYYRLLVPGVVERPIYPVPDLRFPFLGVHLTPTVSGDLEVGPNASLAMGREAYRVSDVQWRDLAETVRYSGFRHLAAKYWRVGAKEVARTLSRRAFADAVRVLVPAVEDSWLVPAGAGIRAQALDSKGGLVDDFVFERTGAFLHVLNAPSPAATASLAIGAMIADRI